MIAWGYRLTTYRLSLCPLSSNLPMSNTTNILGTPLFSSVAYRSGKVVAHVAAPSLCP
jgi:hypothetical protein